MLIILDICCNDGPYIQVSVVHCSAGIEYVPAQSVVMDPAEVANLTFVLYSFHSISQINDCEGRNMYTPPS